MAENQSFDHNIAAEYVRSRAPPCMCPISVVGTQLHGQRYHQPTQSAIVHEDSITPYTRRLPARKLNPSSFLIRYHMGAFFESIVLRTLSMGATRLRTF